MSGVDSTPDAMDARWRAWKAHGVESDRRAQAAMKRVVAVLVILASVVGGWFFFRPM